MIVALIALAILVGVIGAALLTQATTMGVGLIGIACLIGIAALFAQAGQHHQELMAALNAWASQIEAASARVGEEQASVPAPLISGAKSRKLAEEMNRIRAELTARRASSEEETEG